MTRSKRSSGLTHHAHECAVDQWEVSPTTMKMLAGSIKDGTIGIEIKQTGSKLSTYSRKRIVLPRESEDDYQEGRAGRSSRALTA